MWTFNWTFVVPVLILKKELTKPEHERRLCLLGLIKVVHRTAIRMALRCRLHIYTFTDPDMETNGHTQFRKLNSKILRTSGKHSMTLCVFATLLIDPNFKLGCFDD